MQLRDPLGVAFHFVTPSPWSADEASGGSVYLAQAPIQSAGITTGEPHLAELLVDLGTPDPIRHLQLAACNLWINSSEAHSSTHYDPYHNFLCVVSGFKRATLYSPEHAAALYPQANPCLLPSPVLRFSRPLPCALVFSPPSLLPLSLHPSLLPCRCLSPST